MKILLLGKNGQVGWELQRSLAPLGELISMGRESADLSDIDSLRCLVRETKPAIIVNAAAYTAVDRAETDKDMAQRINALSPAMLAEEAKALDAWLVHYSTDYVFDGSGNLAWHECDPVGPLSVYGATKLAGELAVRQCPKHLIFRTSWVYASRGNNFAKTMLRLAGEREHLNVVSDQIGAPTGADLIADVTAHALRSARRCPEMAGLYHLASAGETSWFEYACFVIEFARKRGVAIKTDADAISPIPGSAYPVPAQRPLNSRLCTEKLQSTFDIRLPAWQEGVARMLMEIL